MKTSYLLIASSLLIVACSEIPPQAYFNRGDPENLLDTSSEAINLSLTSPAAVEQVSELITQDRPTRVRLRCSPQMVACAETKRMLDKRGIASEWAENNSGVTLVYERV